ncbi:uncharacterized protein TRIADDRAFT_55242 [Trichoplax adhaerens]|uniref:EamA domain-containing protein n=1 Tax=Trichoplax adhaerens TaxID=10228 RepID=B3RUD2_TRIAD|nr:predicted protein [Trichoplax adhaerens]EDV25789.1 predicted protein [Trichoplax adhaerens]|eukprot:XP_002111822.1 predicted protein [Trichoplax adhaerens]
MWGGLASCVRIFENSTSYFSVIKTSAITTVLRSLVILIGFIGVGATVTPTIYEMITYNCTCNSQVLPPAILTCIKSSYTEACGKDPLFYFMALGFCFLGSLSWSVSAVLWKRYGKMIHYTVGGALMQVIGTITGISLWAGLNGLSGFPLEISMATNDILGLIGFIYAGVLLAFLAALARYALYRQIGPINTDGLLVLIPAVTAVEEYFILRERKWATWSFIVTLVGAGLIIIAGLLGNSPLHDAIAQGLDSSRSYRRKGIYEEGDRDQSNSTDIGGAHDNPYVAVSDQDSNDIKYKGKNKIDLPNRSKGDASSSTDQNIAMEQLRSLDDKLQQEMANINIESSKTSEPSNSQKVDEQLDEQSADAFVLALQKSMENASTSSDSSGPTYGYKKTSLPSSQISPSMSDMIRSPSNESIYSLLNVSHKPNPYKNLIANSRTRADAPISTFDPKKTYVDRPSLSGASSIQQTTKPNPYQRK